MPLDDLLSEFRQTIIKSFGVWHLPNKLWLSDLNQFIDGRRVLEIMSGNGVISSQLRLLAITSSQQITSTGTVKIYSILIYGQKLSFSMHWKL